jgi:hypothetical protein
MKLIIKSALRTTSYLVARNNPDLAPIILSVGEAFSSLNADLPTKVEGAAFSIIDSANITEQERVLAKSVVYDAIDIYTQAYEAYQDTGERDEEMEVLLRRLAEAIVQGVQLVDSIEPASGPVEPVILSRVEVYIQ